MDGLAVADLKGILAPLNFTQPMAEKPYSYNYEPPPGVPLRNGRPQAHQVTVRDARPIAGSLSLDREGFVLIRRPTAAKDLYDEAEIAAVYYPECERLMKEETGATRVIVFDVVAWCVQHLFFWRQRVGRVVSRVLKSGIKGVSKPGWSPRGVRVDVHAPKLGGYIL